MKFEKGILKLQDAFLFIIVFVIFFSKSYAQDSDTFETKNYDTKAFKMLSLQNQVLYDSLKKDTVKHKFEMKKSPWRAVAYSAVLPGLGQFYNGSYWKIPVILGIGGYFVYGIINNNNKFIDYRDLYAESQEEFPPDGDLRLKDYRDFYRNQRDNFILYFGILYIANLVDAYIDAHLFDFDVSEKVKFGLEPDKGLKLNFKLKL